MNHDIEPSTLINVNIPFNRKERIKGIRVTKLGVRNYDNLFEERKDPRGNTYYWLGGGIKNEKQEAGTDVEAVEDGYISVTPINLDLTDYDLINEYENNFADYLEW